jgi:uncharacterized delta-60 repeat protein
MASTVAIQSTCKIIIAGASKKDGNWDFALARYSPLDGSVDTSFGTEGTGKVVRPVSGGHDLINDIAIQSDDKIVAAGLAETNGKFDFAVARYLPDGHIDTGFGDYGKVTTNTGDGYDEANSVVIQPNGKIILAGHGERNGNDIIMLVRYNPDGSLDESFGEKGILRTEITGKRAYVADVALQKDGKIVATGYSNDQNINERKFTTIRYLSDPPALSPIYYLLQ